MAVTRGKAQEISVPAASLAYDWLYKPGNLPVNIRDLVHIKLMLRRADELQWQQPDSALQILDSVFQKSIVLNYPEGAAIAKIESGLTLIGQGRFEASMQCYRESYYYVLRAPSRRPLIAALYINIGAAYAYQNNFQKAFEYYYSVLKYFRFEPSLAYNIIMTYNNIGDVLMQMERYDQAEYYLDKGEELMTQQDQKSIYAFIWVNKADIARKKNDSVKMKAYLQKALVMAKKYNNGEVVQSVYFIQAEYYLGNGRPGDAIKALTRGVPANVNAYSYYASIMPYYTLGQAYFQVKDYAAAKKVLLQALREADATGVNLEKLKALSTLSSIYEHTGQPAEALRYKNKYIHLNDSLQGLEKVKMANELEVQYRTAQKDKEIISKKLQIEQQQRELDYKNTQILITVAGLLLISIIVIGLYRNAKNKSRIMAMKAKMEGEEKERTRIARELHDGIGGMLAVINMRVTAGNENARDETLLSLLNQTAEEIRKTAHNLMPDDIGSFSLEDALGAYVETVNRVSGNLKIGLQIHSALAPADPSVKLSIYRMLQEIIQNICKHSRATIAVIQLFEQNNLLHILVEDNGVGFDYAHVKKGLGLTNLETRVKLLNGQLHIHSVPGHGTTINIELK